MAASPTSAGPGESIQLPGSQNDLAKVEYKVADNVYYQFEVHNQKNLSRGTLTAHPHGPNSSIKGGLPTLKSVNLDKR